MKTPNPILTTLSGSQSLVRTPGRAQITDPNFSISAGQQFRKSYRCVTGSLIPGRPSNDASCTLGQGEDN